MMGRSGQRTRRVFIAVVLLMAATVVWLVIQRQAVERTIREIRSAGGSVQIRVVHPHWYPSDKLPEFINQLAGSRTYEVQFANKPITDADLAPLRNLPRLSWIELHTTHVQGPGLAAIAHQTGLKRLFLNSNPIEDTGLAQLRDLQQLDWLELSDTKINGDGLRHLEGLHQMRRLSLSFTHISDAALAFLVSMPALEQLHLESTPITDASVPTLIRMRGLNELYLADTSISDEGVAELQKALPNCKVIR